MEVDEEQFRSECLKAHNAYRKLHGADPVELDKTLNDYAQNWANTMASTSEFEHSKATYGENIAYTMQSKCPSGYRITKMWYDEEKNYDYATHGKIDPRKAVGHFTQVVWKGTTKVGFGIASKKNREFYAAGSYEPAGNVVFDGSYETNVGRKTGEPDLPELQDSAKDDDKGGAAAPACSGGFEGEMPTAGTSVETKTEISIQNGIKEIKTTTTTTTVTELPDGSMQKKTSTKVEIKEERVEDEATEKLEQLKI